MTIPKRKLGKIKMLILNPGRWGVPNIVKRALVTKGCGGKYRSTGDGPLHLVDVAVSDFRFRGLFPLRIR